MPESESPQETVFRREIQVVYPLERGRIVLRTEEDWERDIEPVSTQGDEIFEFELASEKPWLHFKVVWLDGERLRWSAGMNRVVALSLEEPHRFYPSFDETSEGQLGDLIEFTSESLGRDLRLRVYLPPGYDENRLKHYPVIYMQDGANVFLPNEAFRGQRWEMGRTMDLLGRMSLIDKTMVVALYAGDRMEEYTSPGYEAYAESLVTEVKPFIDKKYRTLPAARHTTVMGSSLGGVVSFYIAWQWPKVVGNAACLSSTFGYRDDLFQRVRTDEIESRSALRIYLDSGWPGDNYENTLAMASALSERGFVIGRKLFYFAFPLASHDESSWASRSHLPIQLFTSRLRRLAARRE